MEVDGSLTGIKNRHCPLVKKEKKMNRTLIESKKNIITRKCVIETVAAGAVTKLV